MIEETTGLKLATERAAILTVLLVPLVSLAEQPGALKITVHDEHARSITALGHLTDGANANETFSIDGEYETRLRPGKYQLVITRGLEYRYSKQQVTLPPGGITDITVNLDRWTNMASRGWYTADSYRWDPADRPYAAMAESIRQRSLGALAVDGLSASQVMAVEGILGAVGFVDVLGSVGTERYYDFLNLGVKLTPSAGATFPFPNITDRARVYVRLRRDFSSQAWLRGLSAARSFASNGPLLILDANGKGMGEVLGVNHGDPVTVKTSARVNPDIDTLSRLELVAHGKVLEFAEPSGKGAELALQHKFAATHGLWVTARAVGTHGTEAVSAPVYVVIKGNNGEFANYLQLPALVEKYRAELDATQEVTPGKQRDERVAQARAGYEVLSRTSVRERD